jgi:hypothetical protein
VEPADGEIQPGATVDETDLLYPDNPDMVLPFVARSYFGGAEVFRIDNVRLGVNTIQFDLDLLPQDESAGNLLTNPSFETGIDGEPTGWTAVSWEESLALATWDEKNVLDGDKSIAIENTGSNDTSWQQVVEGLTVGRFYILCGWLKGENIEGSEGSIGANLSLIWTDSEEDTGASVSKSRFGTFDFCKECVAIQAESDIVDVHCRLGHWGSIVIGKMWCDDLSLIEIKSAF